MTSPLGILFIAKIPVTLIGVAIPMLVLPPERLAQIGRLPNAGPVFRLYGVAILALLVGYGFGLREIASGVLPIAILCVAVVSNLGAAWILFRQTTGLLKLSALFFALVGGGAALALVAPSVMMGA